MKQVQALLDEYLATRRALGARLDEAGRMLHSFVAFLARHQAAFVTTELALQWATAPQGAQPAYRASRLATVRAFARYASASDPRHEIPPPGLLAGRKRRATPCIYSDKEVAGVIAAADGLSGRTGLRPCTYATLLALLAVSGMRASEPLRLDCDDIDFGHGALTVRNTKFGKSRHIPLHRSTTRALQQYAAQRNRLCPQPSSQAFFLSERGTRIKYWTLRQTFLKLARQVGLRGPSADRNPRLHDLRHRFAVSTLLRWYRDGVDVERQIPHLATYLGHARASDTYWYLTATPELLQLVARRLDRATRRRPA